MFIGLLIMNVIIFIIGFLWDERPETVVLLLVSSVLSLLISLENFSGIVSESGTVTNEYVGLFFGMFGLITFVLFVFRLLQIIRRLADGDPDFLRNFGG